VNTRQFLTEFAHIASAPGGIQRLRDMIYQLAIMGALVEQLTSEGNGQTLLRHATDEKNRLIAANSFKYTPKLENQTLVIPADTKLPTSWCWCRLVDIGEINPRNAINDDVLASFIPMSGVPQLHCGRLEAEQRPWGDIKKGFTHVADGDVVLAKITPCFENGKAAVISDLLNRVGAGTTELHVVRPLRKYIDPVYIYVFLRSPYFAIEGKKHMTGTAGQRRLPTEYFATRAFPLPPLLEQKRIVIKVDELMTLCDKLEGQQQQREKSRKLTRMAVFNRLHLAQDPKELRMAWSRLEMNLPDLLTGEDGVLSFQESLNRISVIGRLSRWAQESPPVKAIVDECAALKSQYIRNGWLRRQKPFASYGSSMCTYPTHWAVVPFDEVAVIIGGITKGRDLRGRNIQSCEYLRVANVQRGFFDLTDLRYIDVPIEEIPKYRIEIGDLLITEGGDWDKVGRTAIWTSDRPNCLHQNHIFKARIPSEHLLGDWVQLVFNSMIGRDYFAAASKQTTNLASINMTQLRNFPLPVPPLSEQRAILITLNELLNLCQRLQTGWRNSQALACSLAAASVSAITGIRIEERALMKTPKTSLVSALRVGTNPSIEDQAPLAAILVRNKGELPAKLLWSRSGLDIDTFYQQLKTEMSRGWIVQPEPAYFKEVEAS
jgi:type I restriction enzyme S subunit